MLLNLSPEEALKYIQNSRTSLEYAPSLGSEPLPTDKKSYFRGKIIENPGEFTQENFNANQFHGQVIIKPTQFTEFTLIYCLQDGLGIAKFGYSDWNQARIENINAHGKTEGSYKYVDPNGENYEVQYWADSSGFHRTDNRPVAALEPVTDTPEVKAAILAHQKAWEEAAAANQVAAVFPTHPPTYSNVPEPQGSGSANEYAYVHEEPKYDGPTGKPYGFYYDFDYKVPLISEKNGGGH